MQDIGRYPFKTEEEIGSMVSSGLVDLSPAGFGSDGWGLERPKQRNKAIDFGLSCTAKYPR